MNQDDSRSRVHRPPLSWVGTLPALTSSAAIAALLPGPAVRRGVGCISQRTLYQERFILQLTMLGSVHGAGPNVVHERELLGGSDPRGHRGAVDAPGAACGGLR